MLRKITRQFTAWDISACAAVTLPPGAVLSGYQIHRNREDGEPYVMVFLYSGRELSCPLFRFQPRTQPLEMEELPAGDVTRV